MPDPKRPELTTLRLLHGVASELVTEHDVEKIVQCVTDAGVAISGAAFGAFFYNEVEASGEAYRLYTLSGVDCEAFSKFPMPRNTDIFSPTFKGERIVRLDDVCADPSYGRNAPHTGMPEGHLPVRSYLAIPVFSTDGSVLGGLFFGHPEPGKFVEDLELIFKTLAAQAGIAIDNANLISQVNRELDAIKRAQIDSLRLAAIIESSDDAIISKNLNGIITSWNFGAEQIFGYRPEEVIGQSVTLLIPEEHIDEEPSIIGRIRQGQRVEHYETVRQRKDGSRVEISLTVSPIKDALGNIIGASKIARDISERKANEREIEAARAELAQANDLLERRVAARTKELSDAVAQIEEFSYTVSHDLRAPLRAMKTYSSVLLEEHAEMLVDHPDARDYLVRIQANSSKLDRMIADILAFGRVARDKVILHRVSLSELVRDVIAHHTPLRDEAIDIEIGRLEDVVAHEPSLSQIVSNLLSNAVKFVKQGEHAQIRIWTERCGDRVRLHFEDRGIGIDPAYQDRLFNMFERIHPDLPYEGTGVGLAIVRKATERMGGKVGVESDGITGSKFWVELKAP